MPSSDRDLREPARRERVIELLRRRSRKAVVEGSPAELRRRVQDLEQENARLRRGPQGTASSGMFPGGRST